MEKNKFSSEIKKLRQRIVTLEQTEKSLKQLKEKNYKTATALNNRIKKLNCLYKIGNIVEINDISLEGIFSKVVDILPPAYQYSDITCAQIVVENREFKTKNFRKTKWCQSAVIKIGNKKIGSVVVCYLKKPTGINKEPFLTEAKMLTLAIAEKLGYVVGRIRRKEEVQNNEKKYRAFIENIPQKIFLKDKDSVYISCNESYARDLKIKPEEITGKTDYDFFPRELAKKYIKDDKRVMGVGKVTNTEEKYITNGQESFVYTTKTPVRDERGNVRGILGIFWDITERKQAEEKTKKLYNFQTVIRQINQELLRTKTEPDLFQKACNLLIKLRDIKFVWIGVAEKGSLEIKPAVHAGLEKGYLNLVQVRYDDSKYGKGPTGTAIKINQPVVINDIETSTQRLRLKKEALKRGYASRIALPLIHGGKVIGVLNLYSGKKGTFDEENVNFLKEMAGDIAVGIKSLRLEKEVEQNYVETKKALDGTVGAISLMSELRDPYTTGHEKKVAQLAKAIAQKMKLPEKQAEGIYITGFLHDIGKISVPSEILTKPGRLNKDEFSLIKNHSQIGYEILAQLDFPWPVAKIVLQHHERLNGSGYPSNLKEKEIVLEARILGVADVVEAMSSHRPYRLALGVDKALKEIRKNKGILYDPEVVDACISLFTDKGFKFEKPS